MWRTQTCECGASIIWTRTEKRGKRMPVDATSNEDGKFRLIYQGEREPPLAATILPGDHVALAHERHNFHVCPTRA